MKISRRRKRQVIGALVGFVATCIAYVWLSLPQNEALVSLGPMNTGHENLECIDCHTPARGNAFQQIEANFYHLIGQRDHPVQFGTKNVDTRKCQGCHDRPNDRHPVHRFKEPRFDDARKNIKITECETCHLEHNGVRLTINRSIFCVNCHSDLELKNDPLDVSHEELIAAEEWETCLQCHDFHGNHIMKTADQMKDTIPMAKVRAYFEGEASPYSDTKKYLPKEKPDDPLKKGTETTN